jgi:hypothetical protein
MTYTLSASTEVVTNCLALILCPLVLSLLIPPEFRYIRAALKGLSMAGLAVVAVLTFLWVLSP